MTEIVRDEEIRSGDPRIDGTRISVLDIKRRVVDGDEDAFAVAAEYDLNPAAIFSALAYYYDNVEEMRSLEDEHETRLAELRRTARDLQNRERDVPPEKA